MVYPAPARTCRTTTWSTTCRPARLPRPGSAGGVLGARAGGRRGGAPARRGPCRAAAALGPASAAPAALRWVESLPFGASASGRICKAGAFGAGSAWRLRTGCTCTSWAARSKWASRTGVSTWRPRVQDIGTGIRSVLAGTVADAFGVELGGGGSADRRRAGCGGPVRAASRTRPLFVHGRRSRLSRPAAAARGARLAQGRRGLARAAPGREVRPPVIDRVRRGATDAGTGLVGRPLNGVDL